MIQDKTIDGDIGALMTVDSGEKTVTSYSDELTIDLNSIEGTVSFTVSAEVGTAGTILVIRIGKGILSDLDDIIVKYDGDAIDEVFNVEELFDLGGNTELGWLRFLTTTGLYVFVRVPEFSEHTITISSIVEAIGGITAVALYVFICAAVFFVFLAPMITNIIRRRMQLKKK